jgi:hypothetical protein
MNKATKVNTAMTPAPSTSKGAGKCALGVSMGAPDACGERRPFQLDASTKNLNGIPTGLVAPALTNANLSGAPFAAINTF